MRSIPCLSILALAVAFSMPVASRCLADDAAADFSATANPSGHWSYGASASRGAVVTLYTSPQVDPSGLSVWRSPALQLPQVNHNGTGVTIVTNSTFPPGALSFHPGGAGENSVVRWTAPAAGSYQIVATFVGRSGAGASPVTTTDVAVLHSGIELFSGWINLNGADNSVSWSGNREMGAGETLDFTVGPGTADHSFDMTGLEAVVVASTVDVAAASSGPEFAVSVTPNPARAATVFSVQLARASTVRVRVMDLSGRLVREVRRGVLPAGTSRLSWDGLDEGARVVASGLYLVRVEAGERSSTSKFIVAR